MNLKIKRITRVAILAALVFAMSYSSVFLYNINPAFFLVFSVGFILGTNLGVLVGIIGFFLWSFFNPFGPAPFPILFAQLVGISFSAVIGRIASKTMRIDKYSLSTIIILAISGALCGFLYHLTVDLADAVLFQPFWPRLIAGLAFSLITVVSNAILFPILFPAMKFLDRAFKE